MRKCKFVIAFATSIYDRHVKRSLIFVTWIIVKWPFDRDRCDLEITYICSDVRWNHGGHDEWNFSRKIESACQHGVHRCPRSLRCFSDRCNMAKCALHKTNLQLCRRMLWFGIRISVWKNVGGCFFGNVITLSYALIE